MKDNFVFVKSVCLSTLLIAGGKSPFQIGLPIITTNVSDSNEIINNRFGIVTEKSVNSIYNAMKTFICQPFTISEIFDAELYNHKIQNDLKNIINN